MVSTQYFGFLVLFGHHIQPHLFWFLMNILIRNHFYFILSFYFLSILCICILVSKWFQPTRGSLKPHWAAVGPPHSLQFLYFRFSVCKNLPKWTLICIEIKLAVFSWFDSMGKRRIVRPEDDEEIMADIKRSKLPLESRTGFMERTEHLRQIFMCE